MPELPEVETVRRGLAAVLPGRCIEKVTLHRDGLRVPFPRGLAKTLKGKCFQAVERRGKYLLMSLDGGHTLLCHLGMTGAFLVRPAGSAPRRTHDHAVFTLDDGHELVYHDPRRFGLMLLAETATLAGHPLLKALGPEPFSDDFSPAYLEGALARRRGPVKPALMDAGLVVGVGNIYACEALFRCGIHPATVSAQAAAHATALAAAIRAVLAEAIESGGSTLRDYTGATGEAGYFQHFFYVYDRRGKPCRTCGMAIVRLVQAGRSSFFCPHCQTPPAVRRKAARKTVKRPGRTPAKPKIPAP